SDEILRSVEKELYGYLSSEKPEIFAQPLPLDNTLSNLDFNNPADYEFDFEIGLKPTFEIADLSKAKLTRNNVEVTKEMVDEEISRMQVKAGKMTEPEVVDNDENVLNILFTETDKDGNAVEAGVSKENSVLLKYLQPAVKKEFTGKSNGFSTVHTLGEMFEGDKLDAISNDLGLTPADADKTFKLELVKIGLVEKREMNEEFFNEVFPGKGITTEDGLRDALKEEIKLYWDAQSRNQLHDQLYHYLIDETKMEFPDTFLKRWLQNGGETPKTAEQAETEFPQFSNQLKWTLISDRLITENKLDVSQDELRDHMRGEVSRYFGQMNMGEDMSWLDSYLDRMMKDEKQVDATYRRLVTEKLFNYVESQVKAKDEKVTAEELTAMQHNHQH
ncbi:MAG: trigger factor, partial [Chryseobacterium sp.]